jgi:hypothetical protein
VHFSGGWTASVVDVESTTGFQPTKSEAAIGPECAVVGVEIDWDTHCGET